MVFSVDNIGCYWLLLRWRKNVTSNLIVVVQFEYFEVFELLHSWSGLLVEANPLQFVPSLSSGRKAWQVVIRETPYLKKKTCLFEHCPNGPNKHVLWPHSYNGDVASMVILIAELSP